MQDQPLIRTLPSTLGALAAAAALGIVGASSGTCIVGLASGTDTWCGVGLYLMFGLVPAIVTAVLLGLPAHLLFHKLGLRRWWQYFFGGFLLAIPFWYLLARPLSFPLWMSVGFFDSMICLGSGAFGALSFWFISVRQKPVPQE
jgi:hypothetical protein